MRIICWSVCFVYLKKISFVPYCCLRDRFTAVQEVMERLLNVAQIFRMKTENQDFTVAKVLYALAIKRLLYNCFKKEQRNSNSTFPYFFPSSSNGLLSFFLCDGTIVLHHSRSQNCLSACLPPHNGHLPVL